ncbi:NHL repeat-containing protein [Butyrivibrio sp. VCD2006]|uniref:NHL repeat-containing protein n=1 Tax=Butyrivibrio sp. VCD2006 TaxID=1280664 RepID=UPI0004299B50|nr:NHL repeat-containing protein [Butyrivibrio sp. VCD2006]
MNKKKKKGVKWVVVILVLLVTLFTGSMVACGLIRGKFQNKSNEDEATEAGEEEYAEDVAAGFEDEITNSVSEAYVSFNLSSLPDTIEPMGLCILDDVLYVADSFSKCVWRVTDSGAEIYAGADSDKDAYNKPQGGYNDAGALEAQFKLPWGIAPYGSGIAVTDTDNGVVRIISEDVVDTMKNSDGDPGSYDFPTGIATDESGNIFVSDTHANAVMVVLPTGEASTFIDEINSPMGLFYRFGYLYIAETGNNRIIRINASDVSTKKSFGDIEIVAGSGNEGLEDGEALMSSFSSPKGVTVDSEGTVYVADTVNGAVRRVKDGQVTTIEVKDDQIPDAELVSPVGICIQGGKLYVADNFGGKIFVID